MKIKFFIFFLLTTTYSWSQQNSPLQIIEKEITDWEFRMVGDSVWKKSKVPGTIIDNFVDLSDIANPLHPYYGDNEKTYQWIPDNDWEFRATIKEQLAPNYLAGYVNIEFGCLDLFADVYINNQPYHHENALYPLQIGAVQMDFEKSTNTISAEIRVVIHSTTKKLAELDASDSLKFPGGERVYARKPQYEFGWDWGPKFLNMGIRKPVKIWIHPSDGTNFTTVLYQSKITNELAKLNFEFSVNHWVAMNFDMHVKVKLDNTIIYSDVKKINSSNAQIASMDVNLKNPHLWWPKGLNDGKSEYYTFEFSITKVGNDTVLHTNVFDIPLCDIQLIQEKDKQGEAFYFTVNGKKVYAKGANYVPDDSFDPGQNTEALISLASLANMNMIRVWGGGTYPDNSFYDECMKKGIMVWQDFMFACAMYPTSDNYITSYALEGVRLSERLNKYKNIAVWCGNNENEEGWFNWGWQKELKMSYTDSASIWKNNKTLFHDFYPSLLSIDYGTKAEYANYIPSSPKHGWGRKESMTEGDSHYWGVWWGLEPIERYNEKLPRFMSEFGMQAMPDMSTLKKVIPDSAMNFNSTKFQNHQKHPTGFKTLDHYLKEYLVVPNNIDDYAYATQVLQAYALRTAIEAQRRAMPYCMGSLIWQLNDCWPVTSWSLIDSELNTKISYSMVTSSFEPVIISLKEEETSFDIYIVNDMLEDVKGQNLFFTIQDFYGNTIMSKKLNIKVTRQSSNKCYSIKKKDLSKIDLTTVYLKMNIGEETRAPYTYSYFVKLNQLKLPLPEFKIENTGDNLFKLSSNVFAPYVYIDGTDVNGAVLDQDQEIIFKIPTEKTDIINAAITNPSNIKCLNTLIKH